MHKYIYMYTHTHTQVSVYWCVCVLFNKVDDTQFTIGNIKLKKPLTGT